MLFGLVLGNGASDCNNAPEPLWCVGAPPTNSALDEPVDLDIRGWPKVSNSRFARSTRLHDLQTGSDLDFSLALDQEGFVSALVPSLPFVPGRTVVVELGVDDAALPHVRREIDLVESPRLVAAVETDDLRRPTLYLLFSEAVDVATARAVTVTSTSGSVDLSPEQVHTDAWIWSVALPAPVQTISVGDGLRTLTGAPVDHAQAMTVTSLEDSENRVADMVVRWRNTCGAR